MLKNRKSFQNLFAQKDQKDWSHMTIIHHLQYALPQATTVPGSYYTISEQDFEDCYNLAKESVHNTPGLNELSEKVYFQLLEFKAACLMCCLLESRLLHLRDAITMRTDVEKQYNLLEEYIVLMRDRIQELEKEAKSIQS